MKENIKTLSKSIGEYKKQVIMTPFFVLIEVVMECIIPFFTSGLVNNIRAGCGIDVILNYSVKLVIMALTSFAGGTVAAVTCAKASAGFAKNLRNDIFHNIQSFSFENIDSFLPASLVTRLTTDVSNIQMAFMMIIRTAVRFPFTLVFAFVMAFVMGGKLAFIFFFTVPFLAFGLIAVIKTTTPLFNAVFKKYDRMDESVEENISGIRVVKSFVREKFEKRKFSKTSDDVCKDFTKAEKILAWNNPMMQFCIYVVMVVVLIFGSNIIITTTGADLDVGQLSALLTYSFMMLQSLMMLSMVFVMIIISEESAQRVCEVLNQKSTLTSPENAVKTVNDGSVDFDKVSFKYSEKAKKYALSDVNFHISSGETIGIIGGTGSSKSTLIQLIPRLYDVSSGSVSVGGINVKKYDLKTLRDSVAVVLQKNVLFSGTVRDNLKWGNKDATEEQIENACRASCADEFISEMPKGLDTYIEQGGTNVSGGQKQRLCIARALLKSPKILILDDSTSAVDTATEAKINLAMKKYIPETTKIIIAQRISSVKNADRIIVMDGGKISDIGTDSELMERSEIYREVCISQTKGAEIDE